MPTPYQGNPGNISNYLAALITGASATDPIQITTQSAHGFSTGDQVQIFDVLGNTAANSPQNLPWTITVTGEFTFVLNGSSANGGYTSGGRALDLSLTPFTQIVSGYDSPLAHNVPIQLALDRSQFLGLQQPALYVVNRYRFEKTVAGDYVSGLGPGVTFASTGQFEAMISTFFTNSSSPTSFSSSASSSLRYVWSAGDSFECSFSGSVFYTESSSPEYFGMSLSWQDDCHPLASSSAPKFTGGDVTFSPDVNFWSSPVTLRGHVRNENAGDAATILAFSTNLVTVGGLANMTSNNVGNWLRLTECAVAGNNGMFLIVDVLSASEVKILNFGGAYPDAGSGNIRWGLYGTKFNFGLDARGTTADEVQLMNSYCLYVTHYRPTVDPLNPITGF